jgi:signal transduction histidine kinase
MHESDPSRDDEPQGIERLADQRGKDSSHPKMTQGLPAQLRIVTEQARVRDEILEHKLGHVHERSDQLFFWLLLAQWAAAIVLAVVISPYAWAGRVRSVHVHVPVAVVFGGLVSALPLTLTRMRPGWWLTRHAVAVVQMLWSALLIHLTGGRIETHFHIFASVAFLAFYCDWRLLITATLVVALDHLALGAFWPESVYGISNPAWWRFLEHAAWLAIESVVLTLGCLRSVDEMRTSATREAALRAANTRLDAEMNARLRVEAELRQGQKLEAVGRLASGVAHEINTPIQFVSDGVHFLRDANKDLVLVLEKLHTVQGSVLSGTPSSAAAAEVTETEEAVDLPYLMERMPLAIDRCLDGLGRVASIVRSMKEFAHPDTAEMTTVDLNRAIESTLTVARNEYKYVAELETKLGPLPPVTCHVGNVNQVVLNIVVNAAQAIGESVERGGKKGLISVSTRHENGQVFIAIADTGGGIPESIRERIFDPFFTTKEVGKGTGQGLAVARSIIVDKHGGDLRLESEIGQGTTFHIRLPVAGKKPERAIAA